MARWSFARGRPRLLARRRQSTRRAEWAGLRPLAPTTWARNPLVAAPYFTMPDVAGASIVVPLTPLPPEIDAARRPLQAPKRRAPRPARGLEQPRTPAAPPGDWTIDDNVELVAFDDTLTALSSDETPADPPDGAAAGGQDLSGLIAMFDAEVQRAAMLRGEELEPSAEPAQSTMLRPTLSTSRRRGIRVEQRSDEPQAPHEPAVVEGPPPLPTLSTQSAVRRTAEGGPHASAAGEPPPDEPDAAVVPPTAPTAAEPLPDVEPEPDTQRAVAQPPPGTDRSVMDETPVAADPNEVAEPPGESSGPRVEDAAATLTAPSRLDETPDREEQPAATAAVSDAPAEAQPDAVVSGVPTGESVVFVATSPRVESVPTLDPPAASATDSAPGEAATVLARPEDDAGAAEAAEAAEAVESTVPREQPARAIDERQARAAIGPEADDSPPPAAARWPSPASSGESAIAKERPGDPQPPTVGTHDVGHAPAWFAAPAATVASFGRMTGVDLGFVPIVRAPAAAQDAGRLDAKAFTQDGVIHLPDAVGDVDSPETQALIAHELTHVLQQRALGSLADEDGPLGDAMEAQADAVERSARGQPVADDERAWPEAVAGAMPTGLTWTPEAGFQTLAADGRARPTAVSMNGTSPQRAPRDSSTSSSAASAATGFDGYAGTTLDAGDGVIPLAYPEPHAAEPEADLAAEGVQAADRELSEAEVMRVADRVRAGVVPPQLDPMDPDLLDLLASGLYGRLRTSLRSELISDRERSGVLTEFH